MQNNSQKEVRHIGAWPALPFLHMVCEGVRMCLLRYFEVAGWLLAT